MASVYKTKKKPFTTPYKTIILRIALFAGLYIFACYTPYVRGYPLFPVYVIRCGGLPITATTFAASYWYALPGDKYYGPNIVINSYFCTETEAQAAGFHRLEPY